MLKMESPGMLNQNISNYISNQNELEQLAESIFLPVLKTVTECVDMDIEQVVNILQLHREVFMSSINEDGEENLADDLYRSWAHKIHEITAANVFAQQRHAIADEILGDCLKQINSLYHDIEEAEDDQLFTATSSEFVFTKDALDVSGQDNVALLPDHVEPDFLDEDMDKISFDFEEDSEDSLPPFSNTSSNNDRKTSTASSFLSNGQEKKPEVDRPYIHDINTMTVADVPNTIEKAIDAYKKKVATIQMNDTEAENDDFYEYYVESLHEAMIKTRKRGLTLTKLERELDISFGDHIRVFSTKSKLYHWHHGIYTHGRVLDIQKRSNGYFIMEISLKQFCRGSLPVKENLMHTPYSECFAPIDAVAIARARIGLFPFSYPTYTCKHFARQCKCGFRFDVNLNTSHAAAATGIAVGGAAGFTAGALMLEVPGMMLTTAVVGAAATGGIVIGAALGIGIAALGIGMIAKYSRTKRAKGEYRFCIQSENIKNDDIREVDGENPVQFFDVQRPATEEVIENIKQAMQRESLIVLSVRITKDEEMLHVSDLRELLSLTEEQGIHIYNHTAGTFQEVDEAAVAIAEKGKNESEIPSICSLRVRTSMLQFQNF